MSMLSTCDDISHRVWVLADLQYPALAERCLAQAITDIKSFQVTFDQLWYLGDSSTSRYAGDPWESPEVQLLRDFDVPVRFVMGNHDVERICVDGKQSVPMHDVISSMPGWKTTASVEDFGFVDTIGDIPVIFLSDHVASDGSWCAHHGEHRHGDPTLYPYSSEDYQNFINAESANSPVIIAGHNAFAGGNRPAALQDWFLPLPESVAIHLHGHAHIGDVDRLQHPYRTISYVQDQSIPQIDIASLEDRRDPLIRSAILEISSDDELIVSLRNHTHGRWLEQYRRPLDKILGAG